MTGNDVITKAVNILKYDIRKIDVNLRLNILNDVYAEIYFAESDEANAETFTPLTSISDELHLSPYALYNCIVYGVCAKLALSENDADNQVYYAQEYNEKKRGLPRAKNHTIDVVPGIEGAEG